MKGLGDKQKIAMKEAKKKDFFLYTEKPACRI